ncbi:unnamed protein product, partial [Amoebophrya sp. A25]
GDAEENVEAHAQALEAPDGGDNPAATLAEDKATSTAAAEAVGSMDPLDPGGVEFYEVAGGEGTYTKLGLAEYWMPPKESGDGDEDEKAEESNPKAGCHNMKKRAIGVADWYKSADANHETIEYPASHSWIPGRIDSSNNLRPGQCVPALPTYGLDVP